MANKYGVIRTDLMSGTDVAADIVSVRFYDANSKEAAIENGSVVKVGDYIDGNREVRKATTPAANTALSEIAIIASPEVNYDERKKNLSDFINEAGANCRGYIPRSRNICSITREGLNIGSGVTPAAGYIVELMAGTKLNVVATLTSGSTKVGKILAIEKTSRYEYFVIELA